MRLNKFIANAGHCSRRKADGLISAGKVFVNGKVARELGVTIDPEKDSVQVGGKKIALPKNFTYLMLNKPTGYTTTKFDPYAHQTIYDLIPRKFHHLNPVGRLDRESEGLLLLSDDGDFAYRMTHPKHGSEKTYQVKLKSEPFAANLRKLENGIDINEEVKGKTTTYRTKPCQIKKREAKIYLITIQEGRKRQIRKMFKSIGCPVVYLKRLRMGDYSLDDLPVGQWKLVEKH